MSINLCLLYQVEPLCPSWFNNISWNSLYNRLLFSPFQAAWKSAYGSEKMPCL